MASDASSDVTVQYLRIKPNHVNSSDTPLLSRTLGPAMNGDEHEIDGDAAVARLRTRGNSFTGESCEPQEGLAESNEGGGGGSIANGV
jgi:hypothetical protein